jgi:hypothetical protein
MSAWGYVSIGYVLVFAVVFAYAVHVMVKGRSLSKQVPPENRRWM